MPETGLFLVSLVWAIFAGIFLDGMLSIFWHVCWYEKTVAIIRRWWRRA